jgi:hypothetical protein
MNESDKPQIEPVPDVLDRRGANRAASAWVRNALNEQSAKIDRIADDVHHISTELEKSWKAGPERHWSEHELFREREKERQRLEAVATQEEEKRKAFWDRIKADVISYSLKAVGIFIVGIVVLGTQAKFKEWVQWAVADEKKAEATK